MLSRHANDLYWMARYVERADNLARILDATQHIASMPAAFSGNGNAWDSALASAACQDAFYRSYDRASRENVVAFLAFSAENPSSIRSCFEAARRNARSVRTALTIEVWDALNGAWLDIMSFDANQMLSQEFIRFLSWVKQSSLLIDGSAVRSMLRNDQFFFNQLGKYTERADNTARILDVKYHVLLPKDQPVGGGLDYYQWASILRAVSALTSYHWIYRDSLKPWLIADLLILRREMPRSLARCYANISELLTEIAQEYGEQGPSQSTARATYARLANQTMDNIFQRGLHEFLLDFIAENNRLGSRISEQYLS